MIVPKGSTNVSVYFYIVGDSGHASPGEPITGLLFSDIETGGSASYARQGAARVDLELITLASASAEHDNGGFILVDDTNMPGLYRCDYPDAAFATAVDEVNLQIVVASAKNALVAPIRVAVVDDLDAIKAVVDGIATTLGNPAGVKKNTALNNFQFPMEDTNGTPKAGATVTVELSKDAGAFAAAAGAVAEISDGWYQIDFAAADLNADTVGFKATATGCKPTNYTIVTEP